MIAAFLYRNPRLLVLSLVVIIMAGVTAIWVLPRLEDPILSRRVAVISTVYPGANAVHPRRTSVGPYISKPRFLLSTHFPMAFLSRR